MGFPVDCSFNSEILSLTTPATFGDRVAKTGVGYNCGAPSGPVEHEAPIISVRKIMNYGDATG